MEALGGILVLGGILAFLITGLGYARSQQAMVDCLKSKYNEQWVQLGKPELSLFQPFNSIPLTELVASKGGDFQGNSELATLHAKVRFWFYTFALNFGVVFLGLLALGASS